MSGLAAWTNGLSSGAKPNEWSFTFTGASWVASSKTTRGFDQTRGSLLSVSRADITLLQFWEQDTGAFPGPETLIHLALADATPLLPTSTLRISYLGHLTDLAYQGSNYWRATVPRGLSIVVGLNSATIWNVL